MRPKEPSDGEAQSEQAVIVYLDGVGLPDQVYQEYDLATLEDKLSEVIELNSLGEFDGNEVGPGGATLFMYGSDAEKLFRGIVSALRACPLCQGAQVVIRYGAPGTEQRKVTI